MYDYYKKYIKYKTKYLNLRGGNNKKYAIVTLCMLKPHYVVAACISAYIHKYLIKQINKDIKLVMMCDDIIYDGYKDILSKYYDDIRKISLRSFPISKRYVYPENKYSSWIAYSLNKWKCLQMTEYDKVLFMDVDMLVVNKNFYNVFDYETPAFSVKKDKNKCVNDAINKSSKLINYSYSEYIKKDTISIDGGICLLKPSKDIYKEYEEFTNKIYADGIYSRSLSGPDETSLFYFYANKMNIHEICDEYAVVPWDNPEYNNLALCYNFLSFVKPWIKDYTTAWVEEQLWLDIFKIMKPERKLVDLYEKLAKENCHMIKKLNDRLARKYYNINSSEELDCSTINNIKDEEGYGMILLNDIKNLLYDESKK